MIKYKKPLLITLSVIFALALVGFIFFALVGFDFSNVGGGEAEQSTLTFSGSCVNVEIDEAVGDLEIVMTNSIEGSVSGYKKGVDEEGNHGIYTKITENSATSTLKIFTVDNRAWYQKMFNDSSDMAVIIYLPTIEYASITINSEGGSVVVNKPIDCETLNITAKNGDVDVYGDNIGSVSVNTKKGDINFHNVNADEIYGKTKSGDITFLEYSQADVMSFETESGNITGRIVHSKKLYITNDTGKVEISDYAKSLDTSSERLIMTTVSGNISLKFYLIDD